MEIILASQIIVRVRGDNACEVFLMVLPSSQEMVATTVIIIIICNDNDLSKEYLDVLTTEYQEKSQGFYIW